MKEGWEYKTLVEISRFISDGDWIEKKDQSLSGIRLVQTGNIGIGEYKDKPNNAHFISEDTFKRLKCTEIFENDILISRLPEPIGRTCIIPKLKTMMITAVDCSIVRLKEDIILSEWFKYYTMSDKYFRQIKEESSGTTRQRITRKKLEKFNIPITTLDEQRRIVSYLDSSFKLIDEIKNKALISLTEAKALFQSALAEAMEPKEGWEEKTLGEICSKIGSGATPKGGKKIYIKNGVSIIRSLNVHRNFFKYEDLAYIDNNSAKKLDNVIVKNNDVLFNITGASIARCCVVPKDVLPARVNQHVSIIRIKEGIIPHFLCYLLNSKNYQLILLGIGESGSTRQAITKSDLEHFVIAYPPLSTQKRIVSHLDKLSSKVRAIEEKYQKMVEECDALKQAMLRDVFE